jgi:hypothetical protein
MIDSYRQQWRIARCKYLDSYSDFKEAATELLWSAQIQSQVCYQAHQECFIRQGRKVCQHTFYKV